MAFYEMFVFIDLLVPKERILLHALYLWKYIVNPFELFL